MGRRSKGRSITGWIILDKPRGVGSTEAVNVAKRALNAQKAGHAGTLDPLASGLLAIAFGEATKTIPYVTDAEKAYEFDIRWGQATETDDGEGAITEESVSRPQNEAIDLALTKFRGDIMQVPPRYSAVKSGGARAYDLARAGEVVELEARPLYVSELEHQERLDEDHSRMWMVCGKGGYVRSIARDLGGALNCPAHVSALRRVWSGPFDLEAAVSWEMLKEGGEALEKSLLPLSAALSDLPETRATEQGLTRLRCGNSGHVIPVDDLEFGDLAWAGRDGKVIAIGRYRGAELEPDRVFQHG